MDTNIYEVSIGDEVVYKGRQFARFVCNSCTRCALVPSDDVGTPMQDVALRYGKFCDESVIAAQLITDANIAE